VSELVTDTLKALCRMSPAVKRQILIAFYNALARRFDRPDWTFMNYGYASTDCGADIPLSAEEENERYCAHLYHCVTATVPLTGQAVLEVGCGRGGGCAYIRRHLDAENVTGLDLAACNIAFCRSTHGHNGLEFVRGDALNLPFEAETFDAVVNVESSHCYPSIPRFLGEVTRVLRSGGHFLFADLRPPEAMETLIRDLRQCGMQILAQENISPQVIRALDADNDRKTAMIDASVPRLLRPAFREFSAVKGSGNYTRFANGELVYYRFVMRTT
jgi:ubiquinone/menaquinone biosynthesis C-methylase UbiE